MPDTKLFDQGGRVADQLSGVLRARKRCDGVGLADIHTLKSNHRERGMIYVRYFR